jgi:hypothetical protein
MNSRRLEWGLPSRTRDAPPDVGRSVTRFLLQPGRSGAPSLKVPSDESYHLTHLRSFGPSLRSLGWARRISSAGSYKSRDAA